MTKQTHPADLSSIQFAASVQKALLDDQAKQLTSANIAVVNKMCRQIGGDFYYFNQLNDEQIAFAIGDVVGHGTSAALIMSLIMGTLQSNARDKSKPAAVVQTVNNMLIDLSSQTNELITCSMIYGVVDLPSRVLFYINAGHPEPIVVNQSSKTIHKITSTTMLLGIQPNVHPESCHQFHKGDRLILFTDGLTETLNPQQQPLGRELLGKYIKELIDQPPAQLTKNIMTKINQFSNNAPQQDDQTLILIDFHI